MTSLKRQIIRIYNNAVFTVYNITFIFKYNVFLGILFFFKSKRFMNDKPISAVNWREIIFKPKGHFSSLDS